MKGLTLLFLAVSFGIIGWGYMNKVSKQHATNLVRKNIGAIIFATIVVAVAIFVSTNTTLRLV